MQSLSEKGFAVAGAIWIAILFFAAGQYSCLESACTRGDLIVAGVLGGAYLAPAYFITVFLGSAFASLLHRNEGRNEKRE
ncbi:hypothetical protein [Acidovorax sp. SDU_ACID1]|uniref:hypothetical protein n=1 Tax=Acidovorax sp. SDU_ACID1 TaxID=3136632 RepID=UPI003872B7C6